VFNVGQDFIHVVISHISDEKVAMADVPQYSIFVFEAKNILC